MYGSGIAAEGGVLPGAPPEKMECIRVCCRSICRGICPSSLTTGRLQFMATACVYWRMRGVVERWKLEESWS